MKEKQLRMLRRVLFGVVVSTIMLPARAQVSDPSAWEEFVKGSDNIMSVDTFMHQSFLGQPSDNWEYTTAGGAYVPEGKITVVIPPGGSISFAEFPTEGYNDVTISFLLAANKLEVGEDLSIEYLHDGNIQTASYKAKKYDDWFGYTEKLFTGNSLKMEASTASESKLDGRYMASCFKAFGTLPRYSLFTGSGGWTDDDCWSHLAPYRSRRALVGGDVEVSSSVRCNQISLSDGSLTITEEGDLETDTLYLHEADFSVATAGSFSVSKLLTIYHTFPEKGKWYFLAFPFDVRLSGVDSRFSLEDDRFTGSGNYIYVQTYDGDKRAATQKSTGNWTIVTPSASEGDPLLFERGKGYLVALDAAATDNTLTFSASGADIPANFGAAASIPVRVEASAGDDNDGWYLCGNPLPSPLPFSRISHNAALDGYVYIYNNGSYTAYDMKKNYEIPPLAAFFVKARKETSLSVTEGITTGAAKLLGASGSLAASAAEPSVLPSVSDNEVSCVLKGNELYVDGLPAQGRLQVVDVSGRVIHSCPLPQGASVQPLHLKGGFYILIIEAGSTRVRQKCYVPL